MLKRLGLRLGLYLLAMLLAGCATTKKPDTGITQLSTNCEDGVRPLLDCTREYEQYSRGVRADVAVIRQAAVGFGIGAQQLMQLDSITADLLAHKREVCVQYNNCFLSRMEYKEEMAYLRRAQMKVREVSSQFASYGYPQAGPPGMTTPGSGEPPRRSPGFERLFGELLQSLKPRVQIGDETFEADVTSDVNVDN